MKVPNGNDLANIAVAPRNSPTIRSEYKNTWITIIMEDETMAEYINEFGQMELQRKYNSFDDWKENNLGMITFKELELHKDIDLLVYIKRHFSDVKMVYIENL